MFRITVNKIEQVEKLEKEWQRLHDDPEKEHQYGYVQAKADVRVETLLYLQELDEIDLVAVIDAVNKVNKLEVKETVKK